MAIPVPVSAVSRPARAGSVREVAALAYPIVLTQMSQTLMHLVDSIFVGRLGAAQLGALGFAGIWLWTVMSIFSGTATLATANLSPALAEELSISSSWRGVIILRMERASIAARAGLRPGDILLKINGQAVEAARSLAARLEQPADRWEITFRRDGKVRTIVVS